MLPNSAAFRNPAGWIIISAFAILSDIVPYSLGEQKGGKKGDDFQCPEEFGYYAHPNDCSQYFVCVFGGALLESCTGGLMYSHELQTCDWPRNVGCGSSSTSSGSTLSLVNRNNNNEQQRIKQTTIAPRQQSWNNEEPLQKDELTDRHLYEDTREEERFPEEEYESDRQQRVYRGQPPTLGQVARDRDGIGKHVNALQKSIIPEKQVKQISLIRFDSNQQHQYRTPQSTFLIDQGASPSTSKTLPKKTQYEEYYNSYDEDPELYKDIDYRQYHSSQSESTPKQSVSYQQQRDQPIPAFTQDMATYHIQEASQSEEDDSSEQTKGLAPPYRSMLDETLESFAKQDARRSALDPSFKSSPLLVSYEIPNPPLKLTSSFNFANPKSEYKTIEYERVKSHEINIEDLLEKRLQRISLISTTTTEKSQAFIDTSATTTDASASSTKQNANRNYNFRIVVNQAENVPKPNHNTSESASQNLNTKPYVTTLATTIPTTLNVTSNAFAITKPKLKLPSSTPNAPLNTLFYVTKPKLTTVVAASTSQYLITKPKLSTTILTSPSTPTFDAYSVIKPYFQNPPSTTHLKELPRKDVRPILTSSPTYDAYSVINANNGNNTFLRDSVRNENANITVGRRFYIPKTDTADFRSNIIITTQIPTVTKSNLFYVPKSNAYEIKNNAVPTITKQGTLTNDLPIRSNFSSPSNNLSEDDNELYYDDEYEDDIENEITSRSPNLDETVTKKPEKTTKPTPNYSYIKSNLISNSISTPVPILMKSTSVVLMKANKLEPGEKTFTRGRQRGASKFSTAADNEIDSATASSGRTRPTLKPSTSIVSKATEINIYKHLPKRPDAIYPQPQVDKAAAKCRKDICLIPDCSCGGKDIPGDLSPEETPQMVLLTFDDSVNELNRGLYVDLFEKGRTNPNGCPIAATFYVSHEWTDYSMVQNLYAAGHEIASHSVSHSFGEQFSQRKWTKEIAGQREILAAYGGVRQDDIRGMRAPFLAVGGNKMFKMLYDANFTYDSSLPVYENKPPSWPYTMDYKIFHDCMIPPCPTRSYPGVWEVPMVMWQDLNGGRCSMGDACSNPPDADGVYKMLMKNFERHFTTNRAPFGLFYHSSWFTQAHHKEGFITFLDAIVSMPEVWIVTNWQAIQWSRDPTPVSRLNTFKPFQCDYPERTKKCNNAKVCNLWHKTGVRYLKTCQPCPDVFPWTGKTGVRNSRVDVDELIPET